MAKVYDYVPGIPAYTVSHTLPNGDKKQSKANQLERFIALQPEVQRALIKEGMSVFKKALFGLNAVQQRKIMELRQKVIEANREGDPAKMKQAQDNLNKYMVEKTQVTWSQADIDFHVFMFRPVGNAFYAANDEGMEARRNVLKSAIR